MTGATALDDLDHGKAQALWETAIAAKGGRNRLYEVKSLVISYEETARNFLGLVVHRGLVERLYVFPARSWSWDDGLPPPFSLSVSVLDADRNQRCIIYQDASKATCRAAKIGPSPANEGILLIQHLYLMETIWVRPNPYAVTNARMGGEPVDVLQTRFEDKRIDYYLDREKHLARRVVIHYGNSDRPTFSVEFSKYVDVGGIQMPGKQKKAKIAFQLNPAYDEQIFLRSPSIAAGPHAWQKH